MERLRRGSQEVTPSQGCAREKEKSDGDRCYPAWGEFRLPQSWQKLSSGERGLPHWSQNLVEVIGEGVGEVAPHSGQKRSLAAREVPQASQNFLILLTLLVEL